MNQDFDPYFKWLGIPPHEQPPHYYRLLGIQLFESDLEVISAASDQRMAHLKTYRTGPLSHLSERLLNEVSAARVCLLNPERRMAYDAALRTQFGARLAPAQPHYIPAPAPPVTMAAPPGPPATMQRPPTPAVPLQPPGFSAPTEFVTNEFAVSVPRNSDEPRDRRKNNRRGGWGGWIIVGACVVVCAALVMIVERSTRQTSTTRAANAEKSTAEPKPRPRPNVSTRERHRTSNATELKSPASTKELPRETPASNDRIGVIPHEQESLQTTKEQKTEERDSRLPIPDDSSQRKAEAEIRDVFSEDFEAAESTEQHSELSQKLLRLSPEEPNPTNSFVLARLAGLEAGQDCDTRRTRHIANEIARRFLVEAVTMEFEFLEAATPGNNEQRSGVALAAEELARAALQAGEFALARDAAELAAAQAPSLKDPQIVQQIATTSGRCQLTYERFQAIADDMTQLESAPKDPQANTTVGAFYCFYGLDWQRGLGLLSAGADENQLVQLAKLDVKEADSAEGSRIAAVVSKWRTLAASPPPKSTFEKIQILSRAKSLQEKARARMTGLNEAKARKELGALDEDLAELEKQFEKQWNVAMDAPAAPLVNRPTIESTLERISARDDKTALSMLKKMQLDNETMVSASFLLAILKMNLNGDAKDAYGLLKKCKGKDSANRAVLNNLALIAIAQGRFPEGATEIKKAINGAESKSPATHNAARLIRLASERRVPLSQSVLENLSTALSESSAGTGATAEQRGVGWLYMLEPGTGSDQQSIFSRDQADTIEKLLLVRQEGLSGPRHFHGLEDRTCIACGGFGKIRCQAKECKNGKIKYQERVAIGRVPGSDGESVTVYQTQPRYKDCPNCDGGFVRCKGCDSTGLDPELNRRNPANSRNSKN